jgi:hypothetical protein
MRPDRGTRVKPAWATLTLGLIETRMEVREVREEEEKATTITPTTSNPIIPWKPTVRVVVDNSKAKITNKEQESIDNE